MNCETYICRLQVTLGEEIPSRSTTKRMFMCDNDISGRTIGGDIGRMRSMDKARLYVADQLGFEFQDIEGYELKIRRSKVGEVIKTENTGIPFLSVPMGFVVKDTVKDEGEKMHRFIEEKLLDPIRVTIVEALKEWNEREGKR